MKKILIIGLFVALILPSLSFADLISLRIGYFLPNAKSDLWATEFENMDFIRSNYYSSVFSFSYEYFFTNHLGLVIGFDPYHKQKNGAYSGYVSEEIDGEWWAFDYGSGYPITHAFSVTSTPLQLSLKIAPFGRTGKFIPYIGGGAGLYLWTVRLQGEMIDFTDTAIFYDPNIDQDVIGYAIYMTDAREENKLAVGYHGFGGVMIPIGGRISIDVQVKYYKVQGNLSRAFQGFEPFDLSGLQIVAGINSWF